MAAEITVAVAGKTVVVEIVTAAETVTVIAVVIVNVAADILVADHLSQKTKLFNIVENQLFTRTDNLMNCPFFYIQKL